MKVSLTDICDFQGGTQPPKDEWIDQPAQGYVRMLQIRDFTQSDKNYIEYVKNTGKLKTCIEDDILIGRYGASIGKILTGLAGAYNVAIVKTIPDEKVVSKKYLYWYLNSQYFQRFISNVGSRAAQAGFNKNDLGAAQIPLVDKERQEEICEVLEKANKLISLRKQQLAKLDELVKARFVEMFGEPSSNPMGWLQTTVGAECYYIKDGPHKSLTDVGMENGYPFISVRNIVNGYIDFSTAKYISEADYKDAIKKCCPEKGDILYSKGGTTGIAKLVDIDIKFANWVHLAVLKFNHNEFNGSFFEKMLNCDYCYKQSQMLTKGIANRDLVLSAMAQIKIYKPPILLQNQFAAFVERVDQQKQTVQQSLEKLELMKKALMQEYFG